jgi:hypothetical protein
MSEVMDRLRRFLSGLLVVIAGLLAVTVVWTVLTIPARPPKQPQAAVGQLPEVSFDDARTQSR